MGARSQPPGMHTSEALAETHVASDSGQWPVVTGIFLSYNTGRFVTEAIQSALDSRYPHLEVVCIDDGSTDEESVRLLQEFHRQTEFGTLIVNPRNEGIPRNLNRALALSKGRYVFFIGDDLLRPDKLWDDVATLEARSEETALVHSIAQDMNHDGTELYPSFHPALPFPESIPDRLPLDEMLRTGGFVSAPTALIRRSAVESVGGWNESYAYEDKPMWFALTAAGYSFAFRPVVTVSYRRHDQQVTARVRPGSISYQMKVYARYDSHAQARAQMRRVLLAACAAELDGVRDRDECLEVYRETFRHSRVLVLLARTHVLTAAARVRRALRRH